MVFFFLSFFHKYIKSFFSSNFYKLIRSEATTECAASSPLGLHLAGERERSNKFARCFHVRRRSYQSTVWWNRARGERSFTAALRWWSESFVSSLLWLFNKYKFCCSVFFLLLHRDQRKHIMFHRCELDGIRPLLLIRIHFCFTLISFLHLRSETDRYTLVWKMSRQVCDGWLGMSRRFGVEMSMASIVYDVVCGSSGGDLAWSFKHIYFFFKLRKAQSTLKNTLQRQKLVLWSSYTENLFMECVTFRFFIYTFFFFFSLESRRMWIMSSVRLG